MAGSAGPRGREAVKVVTASGVVGYISTEVTSESLGLLAAKLRRKLAKTQRSSRDPKLRTAIAVALGDPSSRG